MKIKELFIFYIIGVILNVFRILKAFKGEYHTLGKIGIWFILTRSLMSWFMIPIMLINRD